MIWSINISFKGYAEPVLIDNPSTERIGRVFWGGIIEVTEQNGVYEIHFGERRTFILAFDDNLKCMKPA